MKETFGQRLLRLRKAKGLTQEDIASRVTISPQAVSKWENDISSPDIQTLVSLSEILDVSLDELLGKEESNKEESNNNEERKEKETVEAEVVDDDSIHISKDGIHLKSKDGEKVDISFKDGIHIKNAHFNEDEDDDDDDEEEKHEIHIDNNVNFKVKFEQEKKEWAFFGIFLGLAIVAYIVLGIFWTDQNMGWKSMWIVFFIPIMVSSFVKALRDKKFTEFAYPILATFAYLLLGFLGDYLGFPAWNVYWFLFITIPAYYLIFSEIDKHITR